ncbi:MAG: thioredoxin-like domain-containing protein [Armatimonadota bacterium]
MQSTRQGIALAGILLALPLVCSAGCARNDAEADGVGEGDMINYEALIAQATAVRAPEFPPGMEWLNTGRELSLRELRGKFVLLDFWTYCCINCMQTLPDLAYLEHKYAGQPFVVIGVHSAKFTNERDADNIREAIMRYEIAHPVVNDAQMQIWRSYGAAAWPTLSLIDPRGYIVWAAHGEGHRQALDQIIGAGLAYYEERGGLDRSPLQLQRETRPPGPLAYPAKLAIDAEGQRLYISDSNHNRIVVTDLEGNFVEAIGSGAIGLVDGAYDEAAFNRPQGLALYHGDVIVADAENHALRRVDTSAKTVRTIAGTGEQSRLYARGSGRGLDVALATPWAVLAHGDTLYIAMAGTHQIWHYDLARDHIEPYAGTGREARVDGPAARAAFAQPSGLATDGRTLYVADSEISCVRAIDLASREVRTIAGGDLFEFGDVDGVGDAVRLQHPLGVIFHQGVLYLADTYNHKLKIVDPEARAVTSYLGSGAPGRKDGESPEFYEPSGFAAAGDRLYVADTNNHAIRVVDLSTKEVSTLALRGIPRPQASSVSALPSPQPTQLPAVTIAPGKGVLRISLRLPAGHHLTPGAPSAYAITVKGTALDLDSTSGPMEVAETSIPYQARAGESTLTIEAMAYHCKEGGGVCQVRSAAWRVPVKVEAGGSTAIEVGGTHSP